MGNRVSADNVAVPPGVVVPGCCQHQCGRHLVWRTDNRSLCLLEPVADISIQIGLDPAQRQKQLIVAGT